MPDIFIQSPSRAAMISDLESVGLAYSDEHGEFQFIQGIESVDYIGPDTVSGFVLANLYLSASKADEVLATPFEYGTEIIDVEKPVRVRAGSL